RHSSRSEPATVFGSSTSPRLTAPSGSGTSACRTIVGFGFAGSASSTARSIPLPMSTPTMLVAMCLLLRPSADSDQCQVGRPERAPRENSEPGAGEHPGSERDAAAAGRAPEQCEHDAEHTAEHERREDADGQLGPPERSQVEAENTGELDVAEPHAA